VVQGRSEGQRDLLDVESVAGHLLEPGSVFAFLAEHRQRLFPAEMFEDLFPSGRGRPSIPPDVVAAVIVLQTLHGLSDREAADAVTFDLRWKAACGVAVDAGSFHPTALTYWRRRLAASQRPHRIFEVVRQVIIETGAVKGRNRRAVDSTILDDAVARQDTVTQLIAAIRRVAREVPGAAELVGVHCTGHDYTQPGKPRIAWDDPAAREELVSALVNDALRLLDRLDLDAIQHAGGKPAEAVALLALVAGQDVEPAEGSDGTDGRWRIARKTAPDRVISVVDPETRHAHKTQQRRQDGFKAHIVIEPDTGLTTQVRATKASGPENSDATVGADLVVNDPTLTESTSNTDTDTEATDTEATDTEAAGEAGDDGEKAEVLGDSAYGTGDMLDQLDKAGMEPVIKPWPLRPAVPGGFTLDDFIRDPEANTVTCPGGVTRPVSAKNTVSFESACSGCPLREQCTTSKRGRKLVLHEHDLLQRAHRQRAKRADFQATYRQHRPMVERSIAWLVRGNRRVPYRGVEKNNNWLHHRVAALNLRRLLAMGLTSENGTWVLA
jgi:IS5 family transposase